MKDPIEVVTPGWQEAMTQHDWLQLTMAARGCTSGIKDWPHLRLAIAKIVRQYGPPRDQGDADQPRAGKHDGDGEDVPSPDRTSSAGGEGVPRNGDSVVVGRRDAVDLLANEEVVKALLTMGDVAGIDKRTMQATVLCISVKVLLSSVNDLLDEYMPRNSDGDRELQAVQESPWSVAKEKWRMLATVAISIDESRGKIK